MLVIPAPITCPTVLPTATPAAVDAICANMPGCLGCCCAGTDEFCWLTGAGVDEAACRGAGFGALRDEEVEERLDWRAM